MMLVALALLAVTAGSLSLGVIGLPLFVYEIGGGLFQPANIATVMAAATWSRQGTVGAAQRLILNVGIGIGAAVGAAVLPIWQGGEASWAAAAGLSATGFVVLLMSGRRPADYSEPT